MRFFDSARRSAREMARAGMSLRAIARVLGVSTMAAWGWVRSPEREGLVARRPRRQTIPLRELEGPVLGARRHQLDAAAGTQR